MNVIRSVLKTIGITIFMVILLAIGIVSIGLYVGFLSVIWHAFAH